MDSMDDATMNGCHGRDVCDMLDMCEGVQSKQIFWINKPHEGPDKYEFDFIWVDFSDGVKRFICKSDIVPQDYWPHCVYVFNSTTGMYDIVGRYERYERNGEYIFVK